MRNYKFEEVQELLGQGLEFCKKLGLEHKANNSRFAKYRRYLDDLIEIVKKYKLGVISSQDKQKIKRNPGIYVASLIESIEFGEIVENLSGVDEKILKIKFKDILQGPELPTDENSDSNLSRNTLFELKFASLIKRAGIQPLFAKNPDVRCEINNVNLLFECKRPISIMKIDVRIKEGYKQLLKMTLKNEIKKNEGIVLISFAGNCGTEDPFIPFANELLASTAMDNLLIEIANLTKTTWEKYNKPGPISGVYFHTNGSFLVGEDNRYCKGDCWLGLQFSEVQGGGFIALQDALSQLPDLKGLSKRKHKLPN